MNVKSLLAMANRHPGAEKYLSVEMRRHLALSRIMLWLTWQDEEVLPKALRTAFEAVEIIDREGP